VERGAETNRLDFGGDPDYDNRRRRFELSECFKFITDFNSFGRRKKLDRILVFYL